MEWQNRIVAEGNADPKTLSANPSNWRQHSDTQRSVLTDVLSQVGWVQTVIVNRNTGNLVDGHLRVQLAIAEGIPEIPVHYVDLDDEEEKLILSTFDPIGMMATASAKQLANLLQQIKSRSESVQNLLDSIAPPKLPPQVPLPSVTFPGGQEFAPDIDEAMDDGGNDDNMDVNSPPTENQVRMVSLFFDPDEHQQFMERCHMLQGFFQTDNLSNTVLEAVSYAYHHGAALS